MVVEAVLLQGARHLRALWKDDKGAKLGGLGPGRLALPVLCAAIWSHVRCVVAGKVREANNSQGA